jgi:hypothetical protein
MYCTVLRELRKEPREERSGRGAKRKERDRKREVVGRAKKLIQSSGIPQIGFE